jgi:signal transduction histidine kinase
VERDWYDRRISEFGDDLTWSRRSQLASNRAAYDAAIELRSARNPVVLHAGLDAKWLDEKLATQQRSVVTHWAGVLALVAIVNSFVGWALLSIIHNHQRLQRLLTTQARKRARELAQIGAGLAHEIRNPLHALRINLHTLRRAMGGKSSLPPEQLVATIDESDDSIDRLDQLMRDMLMFSDPSPGQMAKVDLVHEVQATLRLLAEDFKRQQIAVRETLPASPAPISIDPTRLRQSLLNLLTFAQHRSGKSGTIEVAVATNGDGIELSVGDSGPAMAADQQKQMFEPFQATAETGSGLGLALVQTYVEEVGGKVSFDGSGAAKSRCLVWFPLAESAIGGTL